MSRKITFLTLFLWLMTLTFPVIAQQKADIWGIERSGFFNGREKWAKGFENQRV